MSATALATVPKVGETVEQVLISGDLSKLKPEERVSYYNAVCSSVGLNPLTRPFEYLTLNNKLTLYARRDCTDQLRNIKGVSVSIVSRERADDLYVVTARATDRSGRVDESIGAVNIAGLKGDALANAFMKCETKAKRRVTLSICGLGMLDETEVETVANARPLPVSVAAVEDAMGGATAMNAMEAEVNGLTRVVDAERLYKAASQSLGWDHEDVMVYLQRELGTRDPMDLPRPDVERITQDFMEGRILASGEPSGPVEERPVESLAMTENTRKAMFAAMNELGKLAPELKLNERGPCLEWCNRYISRNVTSRKHLTEVEAKQLIRAAEDEVSNIKAARS